MALQHIAGRNAGPVMLYALSTCVWCQKTRALLDKLGVAYDYEYVDLLEGEAREKALEAIRKWNPAGNFPTMVVGEKKCIIGFREDEIRESLKE